MSALLVFNIYLYMEFLSKHLYIDNWQRTTHQYIKYTSINFSVYKRSHVRTLLRISEIEIGWYWCQPNCKNTQNPSCNECTMKLSFIMLVKS